jgi:hypothetical protein
MSATELVVQVPFLGMEKQAPHVIQAYDWESAMSCFTSWLPLHSNTPEITCRVDSVPYDTKSRKDCAVSSV